MDSEIHSYSLITMYNILDMFSLMMVWTTTIIFVPPRDGDSCDVMVFLSFCITIYFPSPPLYPPIYSFSNHRVISFFAVDSVTFLLPSSPLSFSLLLSTTLKKRDMFFLCGRTIAAIDENTKRINYRTNLLFSFRKRKFST
jgi:hypothetical protein